MYILRYFLLCLLSIQCVISQDGNDKDTFTVISLTGIFPSITNSEVYSSTISLNGTSMSTFTLENISQKITFLVIQAHSHKWNLTASYQQTLSLNNHVNGTNVGLVYDLKTKPVLYLFNYNEMGPFDAYISVHAYTGKAPIPGGCNMEFNVPDAPYLQVYQNWNLITVDAASARVSNKNNCDKESQELQHDFYQVFLPESDHSSATYFTFLKKMMTVEGVLKYGTKVPKASGYSQMRRRFSRYAGVGSIYTLIATNGNFSSAYVPNHSYGCLFEDCPTSVHIVIFMSLMALLGLFLCLFGHFFFVTQIFTFGFFSTSFLTFMAVSALKIYSFQETLTISVIAGVFGCFFWYFIWRCCGVPLFLMFLDTFCLGFVIATIIYYSLPDIHSLLQNDLEFWLSFFTVVLLSQLCSMPLWAKGNILACAVVGSFVAILPIDYTIGSCLRYMFVNVIRRSGVKNFNVAVVNPPFQWRDIVTCSLWVTLAFVGFLIQHLLTRFRAPFPPSAPPPPAYTSPLAAEEECSESSPLLGDPSTSRIWHSYQGSQFVAQDMGHPPPHQRSCYDCSMDFIDRFIVSKGNNVNNMW